MILFGVEIRQSHKTTFVQQRLHGSVSSLLNPLECLLASVVKDFPFSWRLGWMQEEDALWRSGAHQNLRFVGPAFGQLLLARAACLSHCGCVLFCNYHVEIGRVGIRGFPLFALFGCSVLQSFVSSHCSVTSRG